ncbi:MAG: rhodanese-like domain-containing protein [Gammaproteobacteria bacterium]|jgi:rhodanese-related sulfurtransferase
MQAITKWLSVFIVFLFITQANAAEEDFPGRRLYPLDKTITLENLHKTYDKAAIVDVRSDYEYNTLHIKGAKNIPLTSKDFEQQIIALRKAEPDTPIVFYCNGHTCMKSYKGTKRARLAGVDNVFAFDAGIFDWAHAHPDLSVLLGKSPLDPDKLISKKQLAAHELDPEEFAKRAHTGNAIVLDIRDRYQREGLEFFPAIQHNVPLDNDQLKQYVEQAKRGNKTLLVYDATGHQVRWLQYFLQEEGLTGYYFMQGGAKAYYDSMLNAIR